jgi:hypothetical protein
MPLLRRPLRHTAISLNTLSVARKYPNSRGGAVFFHGGDFDPGGRGDASSSALGRRGVWFAVFDQPRGLTEHWAAGTEQFAQRCGGYITGFLNNGLTPDDGWMPRWLVGRPSRPGRIARATSACWSAGTVRVRTSRHRFLESSRHCRVKQRRRSTLPKFSTVFQSLCSGIPRLRTLTSRHELL